MTRILFRTFVLFAVGTLTLLPQITRGAFDPKTSRDSLALLLEQTSESDGERRLVLLNHLNDVSQSLGDTQYLRPLWNEAVRQKDINAIDDIAVPMAYRYIRLEKPDSVAAWIERNNQYMPEPRRTENVEYLHLMQDISRWKELGNLAEELIAEQIRIDAKREPYRAMRLLYTLGVISSFELTANPELQLKTGEEYMREALDIANTLPFRECAHFKRQILLGISSDKLEYARQYLDFTLRFLDEPDLRDRPFYSRRGLISAYEKLLIQGADMPLEELNGHFSRLIRLIGEYPLDPPVAIEYFRPRAYYYYARAIDNPTETLRWCDSLIIQMPRQKMDPSIYKRQRVQLLGRLKRWEEGYTAAVDYFQVKDSLANASTQQQLAELQTQYDVDRLRMAKERKQQQLLFAGLGCLLLTMLAGVLFYYNRLTRRKNRTLCEQLEAASAIQRKLEAARRENCMRQSTESRTEEPSLAERLEELMHKERLFADPQVNRDSVAAAICTNRTYLCNSIREAYGMTFPEYINSLRLNTAIRMLEIPEQAADMQAIAEAVGYNTYTSFYRAFLKRFGVKPIDYVNFIRQKEVTRSQTDNDKVANE